MQRVGRSGEPTRFAGASECPGGSVGRLARPDFFIAALRAAGGGGGAGEGLGLGGGAGGGGGGGAGGGGGTGGDSTVKGSQAWPASIDATTTCEPRSK